MSTDNKESLHTFYSHIVVAKRFFKSCNAKKVTPENIVKYLKKHISVYKFKEEKSLLHSVKIALEKLETLPDFQPNIPNRHDMHPELFTMASEVYQARAFLKSCSIKIDADVILKYLKAHSKSIRINRTAEALLTFEINTSLKYIKEHPYFVPLAQSDIEQQKTNSNINLKTPPEERYSDIGGINDIIEEITKMVSYPKEHQKEYQRLNLTAGKGIFISGSHGVGKTLLALATIGELGLSYFNINISELAAGIVGESEKNIRELFNCAKTMQPSAIILDGLETLTSQENMNESFIKRVISQITLSLDDIKNDDILIISTTTNINDIPPCFRRAGRFDKEIYIPLPDNNAKEEIFHILATKTKIKYDFDIPSFIATLPGYSGSDIETIIKIAGNIAIENNNKRSKSRRLYIRHKNLLQAIRSYKPAAVRYDFPIVPNISWDDIGGLENIKKELLVSVVIPLKHPSLYQSFGTKMSSGILLYGPPGNGKTLIAKAVANEASVNFLSVKGSDLLNKYLGDSEKAVKNIFDKARAAAPCIIFFDELDGLAPVRSSSNTNNSDKIVNALLTEMDGVAERGQIFILAATNRKDIIDPAVLRAGRIDKTIEIGMPSLEDRKDIITKNIKKKEELDIIFSDIDIDYIIEKTEGYSGADIIYLFDEVARQAAVDAYYSSLCSSSTSTSSSFEKDEKIISMDKIKTVLSKK